ncbi:conserved hypothetical protein [Frankia canadensis]|uniref:Uncharacterized protein n=1 Tax=Frankia canadensis TaxID=1836972 RepID=A0A2I2KRE5_9ACTN|nr:hypothetical protein [Frankia canadensis]SNQ48241.1 conserved hypothetical protein [Frankia canadensis]SOU55531.1 conserved hypothetical protein [Frankia canadensis]
MTNPDPRSAPTVGSGHVPRPVDTVCYEVHRLSVATGLSYDETVRRFEEAVPTLDETRFAALAAGRPSWDEVRAATAPHATTDFLRYWRGDFGWMLRAAGDEGRCVEYLMGNHVIAERMFRHDPGVLLHAPLRVTIHTDRQGATRFSVDQPSTHFRSYGIRAVTIVGIELDLKLATLLERLGFPVPDALTSGRVPAICV